MTRHRSYEFYYRCVLYRVRRTVENSHLIADSPKVDQAPVAQFGSLTKWNVAAPATSADVVRLIEKVISVACCCLFILVYRHDDRLNMRIAVAFPCRAVTDFRES